MYSTQKDLLRRSVRNVHVFNTMNTTRPLEAPLKRAPQKEANFRHGGRNGRTIFAACVRLTLLACQAQTHRGIHEILKAVESSGIHFKIHAFTSTRISLALFGIFSVQFWARDSFCKSPLRGLERRFALKFCPSKQFSKRPMEPTCAASIQ